VVKTIKEAIDQNMSQKEACKIFGIDPRKFRRWANQKPLRPRTAWNKTLSHECDAIEAAAYTPDLVGKPLSHIFVHGHNSGNFYASMSTVYRVLKSKNLVQPIVYKKRRSPYVNAHTLLDQGFSLLCYDASQFTTQTGIIVWAIPVLILPQRYLLHVGHSLNSVAAHDLTNAIKEALAYLPQSLNNNLVAHSDRGSAMKALSTKRLIQELLGAPVHFGRPHTPDDEAWIEALIKTFKYHRDVPSSFKIVDDILQWFNRFPTIYNNDPHSSLKYVTPLQALSGQMEVILNQRKQNLAAARFLRYTAWKAAQPASKKDVATPA
jgi:transposase InsO family protein